MEKQGMKLKRLHEIRREFDALPKREIYIKDPWTAGYFASYRSAICDLIDNYIDLMTDLEAGDE
jgi:hypothetical protein